MGLINLLSVGRSLIGVSHGTGHYKLAQGNLLPNFGGARPVGGAASGAVGKESDRAVAGSKSAAPGRGTGQGELKLEVPPAVATKPALTSAPTSAESAAAAVPTKAVVGKMPRVTATSPAPAAAVPTAPAATTTAAPAPARAEEKFTLGRWVGLMLNR